MRIGVADTGPIHYLELIGQSEVLPALFEKIIIPSAVRDELDRAQTPAAVRNRIQSPPGWLELYPYLDSPIDEALANLDEGERAVLVLAASLGADLLLLDDRQGVRVARNKGFRVIGTLRVLQLAARRGLLDLRDAFERIKDTNFRYRQQIMDELLNEDAERI
jgi:predicted nucleic acid-binding protein